MRSKQTARFLTVILAVLVSAVGAYAHNGLEHVMGTITAVTDATITVETTQHKTVVVLLDPSTKFSHNDTLSSLKDLHIGDRVVIHAKPNADKKLVGVTVKWGATNAGHSDHMEMK